MERLKVKKYQSREIKSAFKSNIYYLLLEFKLLYICYIIILMMFSGPRTN